MFTFEHLFHCSVTCMHIFKKMISPQQILNVDNLLWHWWAESSLNKLFFDFDNFNYIHLKSWLTFWIAKTVCFLPVKSILSVMQFADSLTHYFILSINPFHLWQLQNFKVRVKRSLAFIICLQLLSRHITLQLGG